jgi:hypothetical protein
MLEILEGGIWNNKKSVDVRVGKLSPVINLNGKI